MNSSESKQMIIVHCDKFYEDPKLSVSRQREKCEFDNQPYRISCCLRTPVVADQSVAVAVTGGNDCSCSVHHLADFDSSLGIWHSPW